MNDASPLPRADELVVADRTQLTLETIGRMVKEAARRGDTWIDIKYNYATAGIYLALRNDRKLRRELGLRGYVLDFREGYSSGEKTGGRTPSCTIEWGD